MRLTRKQENMIANLRGLPEDEGRASFDKMGKPYNWRSLHDLKYSSVTRAATNIDSLIEVIVEKYKIMEPRPEDVLMKHWSDVVGGEYAHRCSPKKILKDGRLVVQVSDSITRRNLMFEQRGILKRLRQLPGLHGIHKVMFVAS